MDINIAIIIVLYYPEELNFLKLLHLSEKPENQNIIIVDNTPNPLTDLTIYKDIHYIPLYSNQGIAKAQNIGINKAIELNCTHIIFFDQDSIITKKYIENILSEYINIERKIGNLFLLGPTVINEKTGNEYKSLFHSDIVNDNGFIKRREIISSGSCTSIKKIKSIGLLDEILFIDFVDFEWCWRGNQLKYISGITKNIQLLHNVGQNELNLGKYKIIISSPIRYFYQYRNFLWLFRRTYVPTTWKRNTGIKLSLRIIYLPLSVKNGWKIGSNIWKGILSGIKRYPRNMHNNNQPSVL